MIPDVVIVEIVETEVAGVLAYHARCTACGERCHKQPHDRQAVAVKHGETHRCRKVR